jgi:hypothetical protein
MKIIRNIKSKTVNHLTRLNYEKKIRNDDYRTCGNDCLL